MKEELPLASVVTYMAPRSVWPSVLAMLAGAGLAKNSMRKVVLATLVRVPLMVGLAGVAALLGLDLGGQLRAGLEMGVVIVCYAFGAMMILTLRKAFVNEAGQCPAFSLVRRGCVTAASR